MDLDLQWKPFPLITIIPHATQMILWRRLKSSSSLPLNTRLLKLGDAPSSTVLLQVYPDDGISKLNIQEGEYALLPMHVLAKCLVFLDLGFSAQMVSAPSAGLCISLPADCLSSRKALDQWFIAGVLHAVPEQLQLAALLRKSEAYQLVRFLFKNYGQHKMVELQRSYGLSSSYFRKLSKQALGGKVKTELMSWRAMDSILSSLGGKNAYTRIAVDNGYDSASHFSQDIKKIFGAAPSKLL
ncbi:hypothetical protein WAE56_20285 [Iodobacter sp. LRB]|uniref:hypothetical protein n=1 Tax=unclassified Iodobacter TaxID=235634 RepID=UPI00117A36BA|nr:hypothetical protein [Iodobacter sp. BJB302]